MRIVIAGGHGKIARLLSRQLASAGHTPIGIIRKPEPAPDLTESVVLDLENSTVEQIANVLKGANAAVFAAGAGGGDSTRTVAVDRNGAIRFAEAATAAGVRRFVMISSARADTYDAESTDPFQIYLRCKSEADAAIRDADLDWTIVRPVTLADTPGTGRIAIAQIAPRTQISRADVAALVTELLLTDCAIRAQFEVAAGELSIGAALRSL